METNPSSDYEGCTIVNIHRGTKASKRDDIIYAQLRDKNGALLISASLEYILEALKIRLPEYTPHLPPKEKNA